MFSNPDLTVEIDLVRLVPRVRSRRTCRDEVLAALERLEAQTGREWFELTEIADEVRSATPRYSIDTIRRTVAFDMLGIATPGHRTELALEREGDAYRRHR